MSPEIISLIGILLSLALLIFLAYRGVSILIIGPIASAALILISGLPFIESMSGPYMASYASFAKNNFLIFFCSAIMGKLMGDSGCARGIGFAIIKIIKHAPGNKKFLAICALTLINALLSMGGVGSYVLVFTMVTIAISVCKDLDVPWHVFSCYSFGSGTLTLSMVPGSPSVVNLIPMAYLGTTPNAAPTLGWISTGIALIMGLMYFRYIVYKAEKEGEGFLETGSEILKVYKEDSEAPVPPFWKSIIPIIILLVLMNGFNQSPITAMLVSMASVYLLFSKNFKDIKQTLTEGANNSVAALASICSVVAYAGIVAKTPGYNMVIAGLDKIPLPPIFQMVVAVNVIAGITGSTSGGLGIAMEQLSKKYLAMGINPEVIHRISAMSASGLDSLPHNGSINNTLAVVKLTHKQAYKHYWWTNVVIPVIVTFIAAFIAQFGIV